MAKTIAKCWGHDQTRVKEAHRLGSVRAEAQAATWHTYATVSVNPDGSGWVKIQRTEGKPLTIKYRDEGYDGKIYEFSAE